MSDEEESLIATRKRRINAGSRLKQLLKAEEIANEGDDEEEDNDIDLLFQEDDDDAEFQVGDKDRYGYQESDVDDDDEEGEEREEGDEGEEGGSDEDNGQREGTTSVRESASEDSDNDIPVDNDDMFSDSEDDDSDEDESDAGEQELQKQERAKKRQVQKKARQIPKIISKPKQTTPKKKKQLVEPKADTLLSLSRRQSSRKTAVQNKMDLVERLKEDEVRRRSIKPVAKIEYVEMTQEERLAEAIETEKFNISTLNKYKEQEIDKKKKQRALQLSKRKKLENVVSYKACPIFVTPIEEHELEQFLMTRDTIRRKRDRRGRKSEKQKREEEEARKKEESRKQRAAMFVIQPKSPVRDEEALKSLVNEGDDTKPPVEEKPKSEEEAGPLEPADTGVIEEPKETASELGVRKEGDEDNEESKKRPLSTGSVIDEELDVKRIKIEADVESDNDIELVKPRIAEQDQNTEGTPEEKHEEKVETVDLPIVNDDKLETEEQKLDTNAQEDSTPTLSQSEEIKRDEKPEGHAEATQAEPKEVNELDELKDKTPETKNVDSSAIDGMEIDTTDPQVKTEPTEEKPTKSVKFVEEETETPVKTAEPNISKEPSLEPSSRENSIVSEDRIIFEGPPQKVAANFISFDEATKHYTVDEVKAYLFGPQSLLPPQRKHQEVEPILRLRAPAVSEEDDAQIDKSQDLPDFEFLNNFPKFGEYNKVKKEQVVLETREDIKVVLKTQPPTGIHLPNGSKKQCLITGKPAMYFDPKTGLPYSSVEAYKVIKDIQNGVWAWTEFPGGGSYVCNRENTVHAKGVPEGFDV